MILNENNEEAIINSINQLNSGKLIILPTDTIYGIAAKAEDDLAVQKIYDAKKRSKNKAIAIFLKNIEQIEQKFYLNDIEKKIIKKYLPGAVTIILKPKNNKFSKFLNQNNDNLAVRIADNKFCLDLLDKFNGAIAVSSANISGQKEINNINLLQKEFGDKIDLIITGKINPESLASTIIQVTNNKINILRQGLVQIKI
ncbi:L-threonylcarbamoyladenylate synthase [Rickettsiales bacterium]|nr:L-threonylcarbamoyladenylate synthase [Rickettsiales bacterium]